MDMARELLIRQALFDELDRRLARSGDGNLPWELTERFSFFGEAIAMRQARGKGINKPRQLDAALSITTAYRGPNSQRPYEDSIGVDGYPRYKYESTDPNLATNRAMRAAMHAALPLAYFLGVRKAVYRPIFPVYVISEDPKNLEFALSFARHDVGIDLGALSAPEKVYAARMTRQRLHQPIFREQVLNAYRSRCAVCRLRHPELLDAAHIVGDVQLGGDPVVPNGLALCKIHHAAFDRNFLGITPTLEVQINSTLLREVDGPMLKHGLQEMHGSTIGVPRNSAARPDPERLEVRYEQFKAAS
jgi:putative restriction endonuclease